MSTEILVIGVGSAGVIAADKMNLPNSSKLFVDKDCYFLNKVNSGGDADTNAAVACSILGLKFGYNAIPEEYIDGLVRKVELDEIVEKILRQII